MSGVDDDVLVNAEEASYLLEESLVRRDESSGHSSSSSSSMMKAFIASALATVAFVAVLGMSSMYPLSVKSSSVVESITNLGIFDGIANALHFHAVNKEDSAEVTDSPKLIGSSTQCLFHILSSNDMFLLFMVNYI